MSLRIVDALITVDVKSMGIKWSATGVTGPARQNLSDFILGSFVLSFVPIISIFPFWKIPLKKERRKKWKKKDKPEMAENTFEEYKR